jgi:O-antigen/teichoic acid export membrane protein
VPVSVICYLLFRDTAHQAQTGLMPLLIGLCATASLFKSFNIIDSYFQSQVQSKYVVQVQNICLLISAGIKLALVSLKAPVTYFAGALVADGMLLALGLVRLYHRKGLSVFKWKFNKATALSLLKHSWPLIFSAVMVSLYMKIDQVMLKSIRGSNETGVYSAAAKISEAWYFIPTAIITSVFPAILNARKTDHARYIKRLQNLYDLLVGISLPIAVVISFFADFIIDAIFGKEFQGAGAMLSIHIWSGIFVFLGSASSQFLLAEGLTQTSFLRTGVGAVVNIVLNIWLIPFYGGVGASIATLAAYFIATFALAFDSKSRPQALMMLRSLVLISLFKERKNL